MVRSGLRAAVMSALCVCGAIMPADARNWKPTPQAQALDYAQIIDIRSPREIVFVLWVVPELMREAPSAKALLDKFVIIGVAHSRQGETGTALYDAIDALEVKDGDGNALKPLLGADIPEDVSQFLGGMGGVLKQNLGALGQGVHFFVFKSGGITSCAKGRLVIPFDGEKYTYDVPIPGCKAP